MWMKNKINKVIIWTNVIAKSEKKFTAVVILSASTVGSSMINSHCLIRENLGHVLYLTVVVFDEGSNIIWLMQNLTSGL
jgi:hypothetical protein